MENGKHTVRKRSPRSSQKSVSTMSLIFALLESPLTLRLQKQNRLAVSRIPSVHQHSIFILKSNELKQQTSPAFNPDAFSTLR
jgi:hypothetical protein